MVKEALNEYETVVYIDSSIRFKSNEIASLVNTTKHIGIQTRMLHGFNLTCYTHPKMFEWFEELNYFLIENQLKLNIRNNF
jgi:hypothetical protein